MVCKKIILWGFLAISSVSCATNSIRSSVEAKNDFNESSDKSDFTGGIVHLLWKMIDGEKEVTPKRVFEVLGLQEDPEEISIRPNYRFGSIRAINQNNGKIQPRLIELGVDSINYHNQVDDGNGSRTIHLAIRISRERLCIRRMDIERRFGKEYENVMAPTIAPAISEKEYSVLDSSGKNSHPADMKYEKIINGDGDVFFLFEMSACLESITLKSKASS